MWIGEVFLEFPVLHVQRVAADPLQAMSWTLNGTEVQALLGDTSTEAGLVCGSPA